MHRETLEKALPQGLIEAAESDSPSSIFDEFDVYRKAAGVSPRAPVREVGIGLIFGAGDAVVYVVPSRGEVGCGPREFAERYLETGSKGEELDQSPDPAR